MFSRREHYYQWEGIDANGKRVAGTHQAFSSKSLTEQIENKNIVLLKIKRRRFFLKFRKKITRTHISGFTRRLSVLLKSGITLQQSLPIVASGFQKTPMHAVIMHIKNQIENGSSFAQALKMHSRHFSCLYVSFVEAGERIGKLDILLSQLADYNEHLLHFKNSIRKTMIYPTTVFITGSLVTAGLLWFVVPQFQSTFSEFGATLPLLTRIIIKTADYLRKYSYGIMAFCGAAAFLCPLLKHINKNFFLRWHSAALKIPLVNQIIVGPALTTWFTLLETSHAAGIPLCEALTLSNQSVRNRALQKRLERIAQQVNAGQTLNSAMHRTHLFCDQTIPLITIGEASGALDEMLGKVRMIYQERLDHLLDKLKQLLEPTIMLLLALFTGGLIIALYLPVFRLGASF